MTETKLSELMEQAADQTPVGPPPLDALRAGAVRRRRRRTAGLAGVAVVAAATVVGGTTLLTTPPPVTTPPAATRVVGFGHAAIAVPADWPTNKASCGTPQQDTVLIDDPSAAHLCQSPRPKGVDSVQLSAAPTIDFHADQTIVIDGVQAQRQVTSCLDGWQRNRVCSGAVGFPSLKVWFRAESSTGAADVDRMLSRIHVVRDRSGVPSYSSVGGAPTGPLVAGYAPVLEAAGLTAQHEPVRSPSYPAGTILGVSPAVGTMLPLGSTVTVTVAR